jgi:hypothetical protein
MKLKCKHLQSGANEMKTKFAENLLDNPIDFEQNKDNREAHTSQDCFDIESEVFAQPSLF